MPKLESISADKWKCRHSLAARWTELPFAFDTCLNRWSTGEFDGVFFDVWKRSHSFPSHPSMLLRNWHWQNRTSPPPSMANTHTVSFPSAQTSGIDYLLWMEEYGLLLLLWLMTHGDFFLFFFPSGRPWIAQKKVEGFPWEIAVLLRGTADAVAAIWHIYRYTDVDYRDQYFVLRLWVRIMNHKHKDQMKHFMAQYGWLIDWFVWPWMAVESFDWLLDWLVRFDCL